MANPGNLVSSLASRLQALEHTRRRMESLFSKGLLVRRDVEEIYKGLYVTAFTSFEGLIENYFEGMLTGHISPPNANVVPHVTFRSKRLAHSVVCAGRNYADWIPYEHTERRAKSFFRRGRPFSQLTPTDKNVVKAMVVIRHAIAHRSNHAINQFRREITSALNLIPRERTPAGFLRSVYTFAPRQTRYELYSTEMFRIAQFLCN